MPAALPAADARARLKPKRKGPPSRAALLLSERVKPYSAAFGA
jgi:hypothetical protein